MYIKVINPKTHGKYEYNNSGTCRPLINYLSKEDKDKGLEKEFFFSHSSDMVTSNEVIQAIDGARGQLAKDEAKFYSLVIAPRPEEMEHIKNNKQLLKSYTRDVMDIYAQNFNKKNGLGKDLKGEDLIYFGKLEENRYYRGDDPEVVEGKVKQGDPLPGDNTHIHVIVSRKDKTNKLKLSPLTKSKKLFSREDFKLKSCTHFDKNYRYQGAGKELEKHLVMRDGSIEERIKYIRQQYEQSRPKTEQKEQKSVQESVQENHPKIEQKPRNRGLKM